MIKFSIDALQARSIAKTIAVAMSCDKTNYNMNGVCLDASMAWIWY